MCSLQWPNNPKRGGSSVVCDAPTTSKGVVCREFSMNPPPQRGWSVGRAGLGAIATYPACAGQSETDAIGVGLFPFCLLFCFLDEYKASLIYIRQ